MMKKMIVTAIAVISAINLFAQSYTETFDSNSLEWTERAYKNAMGTAIIDKGVLEIESYETKNTITSFESHCYAPLDIKKPFSISSDVTVKKGLERGLIFNFRDFGNYYAFVMTDNYVKFIRYENGKEVGFITQGIKWKKTFLGKLVQTWVLKSDGVKLEFIVNDEPIMNVRYMPLEYSGFGYYTVGECKLIVDQVTFTQGL